MLLEALSQRVMEVSMFIVVKIAVASTRRLHLNWLHLPIDYITCRMKDRAN